VWSKALEARPFLLLPRYSGLLALPGTSVLCCWQLGGGFTEERSQRQEGMGVGDGVRLHERSKALKGKPHERIWPEIVASRRGAGQSVKRLRKPEDAGTRVRQARVLLSHCTARGDAVGARTSREEVVWLSTSADTNAAAQRRGVL